MYRLASALRQDAKTTRLRVTPLLTDFEQGLWEGIALGLTMASAELEQFAKNAGYEKPEVKNGPGAEIVPLRRKTKP